MYFDTYRVKLIASTPISMITGDTSILFLDVLAERFDKICPNKNSSPMLAL